MGNLQNLIRLGIRYNKLRHLPSGMAFCHKLEEFIVESNQLEALPEGMLTSLPNLKTINLSRNELTVFPSGGPQQFASCV
ncbi:hypothetical protein WUBG_16388, partial [Wuchereria bancrofti]